MSEKWKIALGLCGFAILCWAILVIPVYFCALYALN